VSIDESQVVRRYYKDDSVLLDSSTLRHRKRMQGQKVDEENKEERDLALKKLPKGKDKTQVIYVQVPDDSTVAASD